MKITKGLRKMIHYHFLLLLVAAFMMNQTVLAQGAKQITASGTIVDAKNEPLFGVSVVVEGTTNGAITDINGKFTLNCPQGSKLQISYVGYKKQKVAAASSMKLVLQEDAIALAGVEVVGVGYGTMRKADLTGAISSVSASDMKQGVITSSEQLLQGKIAGLSVVQGSGDPTAGASMKLRGGTSLSASNGPLIVIDGVSDADMNSVQSSEIVSIDVLKDASACAIYGSRGANGVIIVTTNRKDKSTNSAQYTTYMGVGNASKELKLLTASNFTQHGSEAVDYGANTDWQKQIQQTAVTQSHALTFSNSNEKGGFNGSLSYLDDQGVIKTTDLNRVAAGVSGFANLWDNRLRLESSLHVNQDNYSNYINPSTGNVDYSPLFQRAYAMNPTLAVKDANGNYIQDPSGSPFVYNPVEILEDRSVSNTKDRILSNTKAELTIIDGLKATASLSYTDVATQTRSYIDDNARLLGLQYGGLAQRTYADNNEGQLETYLNYDKTFDKVHKINLMGGYSYSESEAEGFGGEKYGFQSDAWLYNNLAAATSYMYMYSYKNTQKLISFFGRANYSYASKYMFTATLRKDGSSVFGEDHKWGYFPSGSAAWRITDEPFMQEYVSPTGWLNNLKLRAGYGLTGNQGGIAPYTSLIGIVPNTTGTVTQTTDNNGNPISAVGLVVKNDANPDLRWESTAQFNIGLDFTVVNSLLTGTIEAYSKKTSNLLYAYDVGTTSYPVSTMLINIGDLTNNGVEFTLNANIMKTKDFSWTANVNFAHNVNDLTKITDPNYALTSFQGGTLNNFEGLATGSNYTQALKEGYAIGSFFGAKSAGRNADGQILYWATNQYGDRFATTNTASLSAADKNQYLGNAQPKLTMGFNMNFTYKNFDLGISTYGMFGEKVYNATAMDLSNVGRGDRNILASALNQEQANFISDYWLEDASFFRLQDVTLGYTIDLKKIKMSKLRVYATVENLLVITKYSGVDPEVSTDINVTPLVEANRTYPGIDAYNNYPKPRTFLFGLQLQF
jgi:iron complex outermembrane receptor protein